MSDAGPDVRACDQDGCPYASEGRCLEGFDPAEACPHLTAVDAAEVAVSEFPDDGAAASEADEQVPEETLIYLGGDFALTLDEAQQLATEHGVRVVLVAGEFESGKTTLLVELYGRFLKGPFAGFAFAGARTLDAFDKRHFPTRHDSGRRRPGTDRTTDEDTGILHLRIWDGHHHLVLMFADVEGEMFEHIADGQPVAEQVPVAARADCVVVLLDGELVAKPGHRGVAFDRARQLIGGLAAGGGVPAGRPLALVLSKSDRVHGSADEWYDQNVGTLVEHAVSCGFGPVEAFKVAARPENDQDNPINLDHALQWISADRPAPAPAPRVAAPTGRAFLDLDVVPSND